MAQVEANFQRTADRRRLRHRLRLGRSRHHADVDEACCRRRVNYPGQLRAPAVKRRFLHQLRLAEQLDLFTAGGKPGQPLAPFQFLA